MAYPPEFIRFAEAFRADRFEQALALIDPLIARHPDSPALRWHRVRTLQALGHDEPMRTELARVLEMRPDYVPAIVLHVRCTVDDEVDDSDWDELEGKALERRQHEHELAQQRQSLWAEQQLRPALAREPDNLDALELLANVLQARSEDARAQAESLSLLDRALTLAPGRVDLREWRAMQRMASAMSSGNDADEVGETDTVQTFVGLRQSRSGLEAALADYERCHADSGEMRYAVRAASILHDLGRHDEAVARYDRILAELPPDHGSRAAILERRRRSENGGAGEREEMAHLLQQIAAGDGKDRTLQDDVAAQVMLGLGQAMNSGASLGDALQLLSSDDPNDVLAFGIAQQVLAQAFEPPPELESVSAADYPVWQRRFADRITAQLQGSDLLTIGDVEARGMFPMLGQHVLLRLYTDPGGSLRAASYAMRPKWPGWAGFLVLLLTGRWKTAKMFECISHFDDGTHLVTQWVNPSPFEYGGPIDIERMPLRTAPKALVERHRQRVADHQARNPAARALSATDLAGVEELWIAGQEVKRDYRASIGYVTDAELRRILGAQYARLAAKVKLAIRRIARA